MPECKRWDPDHRHQLPGEFPSRAFSSPKAPPMLAPMQMQLSMADRGGRLQGITADVPGHHQFEAVKQ